MLQANQTPNWEPVSAFSALVLEPPSRSPYIFQTVCFMFWTVFVFFNLILFIDQTQHVIYIYILIVEAQNNVFKKKTEIEFSGPQSKCHMGKWKL